MRSASVPSDILSELEHDLCGSRSPLIAAPRNLKVPGRGPRQAIGASVDSSLPKFQGRRSQRSIPSILDASWEDPGPTVEFYLTQLDWSDEDQCNLAEAGRNVMPRLGDR